MSTHQVHVQSDMSFNPKDLPDRGGAPVHVGDTVEWIWDDDNHSVTADSVADVSVTSDDDARFNSGVLNSGARFAVTFRHARRYPYYCVNHGAPGGEGMSGTVTVT